MTRHNDFYAAIAGDSSLKETDLVVAVAWFFAETSAEPVTLGGVVDAMEAHAIRGSINRTRLRTKLKAHRSIVVDARDQLRIKLAAKPTLAAKYAAYLESAPRAVADTVLEAKDFENARPYIQKLAYQVNASFEFHLFDCCAVMMRRLMEVSIIEAYDSAKKTGDITTEGEYLPLSGLIGRITSGTVFKLPRGIPQVLEAIKTLGDNGAHSRTYITKRMDIEQARSDYRRLISELRSLQPRS